MAVIFEYLGNDYSFPQNLEDVPFKVFIDFIEKVQVNKPEVLRTMEENMVNESMANYQVEKLKMTRKKPFGYAERLKEAEQNLETASQIRIDFAASIDKLTYSKYMLPYFAEVVSHFTGIPTEKITGQANEEGVGMEVTTLETLYWSIASALEIKEDDYDYQKDFKIKGRVYELPDQFMKGATVIEFMESAQLQSSLAKVDNGYFHAMIEVASVLLKRKNERFSDAVFERNKADFQDLSTSVIVQVTFFLLKPKQRSKKPSKIYTIHQSLIKLKRVLFN